MSLMGIDVGTTGVKAVIFNADGKVLGQGYCEYPLIYPGGAGWVELDSEQIWQAVKDVIQQAVSKSKNHDPVEAIAVSSMGETAVPLDAKGEPLSNAIANLDTRSTEQANRLEKELEKQAVFNLTGHPIHPMYTLPKLMWLKDNRPDVFRMLWKFLCIEDFTLFRLGVTEPVIDWSLASRTMGFDILRKRWCLEILQTAGIDEKVWSKPLPSGEAVGTISKKLSDELNLPSKVVLVTGGHDQPCGCLGCGVVGEGIAMDAIGTVDCITVVFNQPVLNEKMLQSNFCCYPHVVSDLYVTVTWTWTGGILLRWYRDTFASEEKKVADQIGVDVYDLNVSQASPKPTHLFVLPHFTPTTGTPWMDSQSKGVIAGLTLETSKGEFIRALLEGINYEMKLNLELLRDIGIVVKEIRAIGGGAKSSFWLQLKANIFGVPVASLKVSESACFGAALLAGKAVGKWQSVTDVANNLVKIKTLFEPNSKESQMYQQRFNLYKQLYLNIKDWLHQINMLQQQ